jgi:hypothetical protein
LEDRRQSSGKIHSVTDLIQDVSIGSVGRQNLANHKVCVLCIFERHIPRLELLVKLLWQIDRYALIDSAIRHFHEDRRQVEPWRLPIL